VQLKRPLTGVEDAPEMMAEPAGQVLDGDLRHQVLVELRPDPGQRPGQDLGAVIGRVLHQVIADDAVHELPERGGVVAGPVGEPAADHARLQPVVQPRGHDRVLQAGHHDDLVDERVIRAAPPFQLLAQRALLRLAHVLDHQDLEVLPVGPGQLHGIPAAIVGVVLAAQVPGLVAADRVGSQRAVNRTHQRGEPVVLAGGVQPPDLLEGLHAGEGPEPLDRPEDLKQSRYGLTQLLDGSLLGTGEHQLGGRFLQAGPGICPELGIEEHNCPIRR
jgi:hypothetical protein